MEIIEELITKKPYLEDPLRFYERSIQFTDEVRALNIPSSPGMNAYPPRFTGPIIERFLAIFDLPEGTVYPALHRLEEQGLLASTWEEVGGRRKRIYSLTASGRQALAHRRDDWQRFSAAINSTLGS